MGILIIRDIIWFMGNIVVGVSWADWGIQVLWSILYALVGVDIALAFCGDEYDYTMARVYIEKKENGEKITRKYLYYCVDGIHIACSDQDKMRSKDLLYLDDFIKYDDIFENDIHYVEGKQSLQNYKRVCRKLICDYKEVLKHHMVIEEWKRSIVTELALYGDGLCEYITIEQDTRERREKYLLRVVHCIEGSLILMCLYIPMKTMLVDVWIMIEGILVCGCLGSFWAEDRIMETNYKWKMLKENVMKCR